MELFTKIYIPCHKLEQKNIWVMNSKLCGSRILINFLCYVRLQVHEINKPFQQTTCVHTASCLDNAIIRKQPPQQWNTIDN